MHKCMTAEKPESQKLDNLKEASRHTDLERHITMCVCQPLKEQQHRVRKSDFYSELKSHSVECLYAGLLL